MNLPYAHPPHVHTRPLVPTPDTRMEDNGTLWSPFMTGSEVQEVGTGNYLSTEVKILGITDF